MVFMGTPEFSVPSLEKLVESGYWIAAVVTQPDRRRGRGQKLEPSRVKKSAQEHGLRVLQPERVRDTRFLSEIRSIAPDVIVTIAFGQILPRVLLDIPPMGCINVHPSLLPRHRGAAPINWAIIKGEEETGVTTIIMDQGMDTGDILLQRSIQIEPDDTAGTLQKKLSILGADLLIETLSLLEQGSLEPKKQDIMLASHAPMFRKLDGRIDWSLPAETVRNRIRGLDPWPGAFTEYKGEFFKIFSAIVSTGQGMPGEIMDVNREGIIVGCGKGALIITEVQPPGRRRMRISDFLCGRSVNRGDLFV